jgi:hypothetical protein
MWQVIELDEGAPGRDALLAQVAGVTIDREALLRLVETAAARGLRVPRILTHELELGPEARPSSLYAAEVWGRQAADAAPGEMYVDENGQLIWNLEGLNAQIRTTGVHHDKTAMIAGPRGGTVAEVTYDPEPEDRALDDHLARWWADREPYSQAWIWREGAPADRMLDWRLYLGADTTIAEGQTRFQWVRGRMRTWLPIPRFAGSAIGTLIGKVFRIYGAPAGILNRDPLWLRRLAHWEKHLSAIATQYPRLDAAAAIKGDPDAVTVIVHGTMSCGLPGLKTLHDAGCIAEPTLRYEHDTFTGIAVNATELASLIRQRFSNPGGPRIRLIGHSRGGLVARWARDLLADDPREVEVVTLGTPHRGTPFVGRALGAIAGPFGALGRVASALRMDTLTDSGGAPITDPFTLAIAYMVRPGEIPEGIRSMAPHADVLAALERMRGAADFTAVGGECDLTQAPSGFVAATRTALASQLFGPDPNDLIVALASSRPRTTDTTVACAHSEYFHDGVVQAIISGSQAGSAGSP